MTALYKDELDYMKAVEQALILARGVLDHRVTKDTAKRVKREFDESIAVIIAKLPSEVP